MNGNYLEIKQAIQGAKIDLVIKRNGSSNLTEENYKLLGDIGAISKLDSEVKKWSKFLQLEVRKHGNSHYVVVVEHEVVVQDLVMPVKLGYSGDESFFIDQLFHHLLICGMPRQGKSTLTHLHLLYVLENYPDAEIALMASTKREFSQDLKRLRYPIAHDISEASRYLSDIKQEVLEREDNGFEGKAPIFVYIEEVWEFTEDKAHGAAFNKMLSYIVRKGARNHVYLIMNLHTPKAGVIDGLVSGNCLSLSFYQSRWSDYGVSIGQSPNGRLAPQQFYIDYDGLKVIQVEKATHEQLEARYLPHIGVSEVDSGILPITPEELEQINVSRQCAEANNGLISTGKLKDFMKVGRPVAVIVFETLRRHRYIDDSLPRVNQQWEFLDK